MILKVIEAYSLDHIEIPNSYKYFVLFPGFYNLFSDLKLV